MKHLLALLVDGTHGTRTEPPQVLAKIPTKRDADQSLARSGTRRTLGTLLIYEADIAQRVDEISEAWRERRAIVLEAGDIGETKRASNYRGVDRGQVRFSFRRGVH